MPSVYKSPTAEQRVHLALRLPISLRRNLEQVAALWRERARGEGADASVVAAINLTHTAITLLGSALEDELAALGRPEAEGDAVQ